MRVALPSLMLLALACGGSPRPQGPKPPPLPEGTAVYQVRYNPPTCLADRPELHVEVETPQGWERVALEEADEELDLVGRLLDELRRTPQELAWVRADLSDRARAWAGNHASRVLQLIELNAPPPPPEAD